ncbi:MAG: MATE family efflux transporter [Candidatus Kapaibacterium sp.]
MSSAFAKRRVDLINDPVGRSLRLFSVPIALSFIINMIYSLVDRYYVSRLGDAAIAAIGSTDQIVFFLFTLVSGIAVGAGIIVSRRFGEGDAHGAQRTATQSLVGMALMAAIVTVVFYLSMSAVPVLMRMPSDVAVFSMDYLSMLLIGFTFNLMNFHIFSLSRSSGNAMFPTIVLVMTVILNAVIAPFLIFGIGPFPEMGMKGAGLATALSQISGTVISLVAIGRGKTNLRFDFSQFRLDADLLIRVFKQGLPASLQMLSVSLNRALIFAMVGAFGTSATAAYTLGLNVDMMVFMTVFAVGIAVQTATGQNLGAGKPERVWQFFRSAALQLSVLMAGLAVVVLLFGREFVAAYTRSDGTIEAATQYLHITVFGYVFFAVGLIAVRVISGAGASTLAMVITAGSLIGIQLPLCYALSHTAGMGQMGIWVGVTCGYAIFCCIAYAVLKGGRWLRTSV